MRTWCEFLVFSVFSNYRAKCFVSNVTLLVQVPFGAVSETEQVIDRSVTDMGTLSAMPGHNTSKTDSASRALFRYSVGKAMCSGCGRRFEEKSISYEHKMKHTGNMIIHPQIITNIKRFQA